MSKSIGLVAKFAFVPAVVAFALSLSAGNVCTWRGGSGKFSDANWDVAPVSGNGDTLVFDTSNGAAISVENDLGDDFAIYAIKTCVGENWKNFGQITLTGQRLYFNATASRSAVTVIECGTGHPNRGAPLTFDLPLRFRGGGMKFSNTVVFNRKVTIDDDGFISLGWPEPRSTTDIKNVTFNDEIYGPNAAADIVPGNGGYGSRLDFNGKLTLKELWNNGAFCGGKPKTYFNKTGGTVKLFGFKYNHQIYFPAADVFGDAAVIKDVSGQKELGVLTFQANQTIDRFVDEATTADYACRYTADKTAVVTQKASASTTVRNSFEGKLSLVWDPLGDFTFTLDDHLLTATNTMSGTIEVKGGTFAVKGGAHFTALSGITVRNGATFSLAQATAVRPIPNAITLSVDAGGTVAIPAGMTLAVSVLFVAGDPVTSATVPFTKDNCDWITGDGAVEYRPVMTSVGSLPLGESLFEQTKCWTNAVLGVSVEPRSVEAANFDYSLVNGLRTPQNGGVFVYNCRSLTVGVVGGSSGSLSECSYRGVVTNCIENEGLYLAKGSIAFNSGRFGKSTWTGKITVLSPQGSDFTLQGGNFEDQLISQLFLSGRLIGAPEVGLKAGGAQDNTIYGPRVTIDADASEYYGRLKTFGPSGWVSIGNTVFNGSVVCEAGCAFGAELPTDTAQLKSLSFAEATPFVVPVDALAKTAGLVVVTNSFSQSAKVTVYHRARMWHGRTPILKLAAGCSGTLDSSQFEFGGYMTPYRAPSDDAHENWPKDLHLEVGTDPNDNGQVLYLVSDNPGLLLIVR